MRKKWENRYWELIDPSSTSSARVRVEVVSFIDDVDDLESEPASDIPQVKGGTWNTGELFFRAPDSGKRRLPDTLENKQMLKAMVAEGVNQPKGKGCLWCQKRRWRIMSPKISLTCRYAIYGNGWTQTRSCAALGLIGLRRRFSTIWQSSRG